MPDTFIPNSIKLGSGEPLVVLLTGPNMGGKSTILRQTSIAVIMAQIGCYVFADKCIMTPVDRIFTRIGAQDHIFEGQSTFMVELIEAGLVLHQATQHSLVILDELGRGTSTFDGYSLAYAVLKFISEMIGCRTLFSTHYHMLTDEFKDNAAVALHHMKCITDPTLNKITFLYQMDRGVCPKSYGMNVAHMANLPLQVIQAAEIKAKTFEEASQLGHYK
jgi:DNA mismatch repair protein MSH6